MVGWTYESDQEAISEARSTLEDLETEKEEEDLQYRIDQLEKTIDFLEAIPDSAELEAQKAVYNEWIDLITESNATQLDILTELQNAYTSIGDIAANIQTWISNDEETAVSTAASAYADLTSDSAYTEGSLKAAEKAASVFQKGGEYANGAYSGTPEYIAAAEVLNQALAAMKDKFQNINSLEQNYTYTGTDGKQHLVDWNDIENPEVNLPGITDTDWGRLQDLYDTYVSLQGLYKSLDTTLAVYAREVINENFRGVEFGGHTRFEVDTASSWGSSADLVRADGSWFNRYHDKDCYLLEWDPATYMWTELAHKDGDFWEYSAAKLQQKPAGTFLVSATENWQDPPQYAYKIADDEWVKAYAAAKGSLGLPGGPTLINEEGTEGIITPYGTLTALPAKTGVVPATLTSNLSELGEVAPNLIKSLDSLSFTHDDSAAALFGNDDHSTNVQNLYATFQAEEGFDFEDFLADVRSVINTTRHSG